MSEPKHMSRTEAIRAVLRPRRSARRPNRMPPIGRTKKPRAKMPAVDIICAVGSWAGKKELAKYSANAE